MNQPALDFVGVATAGLHDTKGSNLTGAGSNIGDLIGGGGLAAAFDATTSQGTAACANHGTGTEAYVGKDFSAAPKRIYECIVFGSNNHGYIFSVNPSITIDLYGKNGSAPSNGSDGTSLGQIAFTDTANESVGRTIANGDDYETLWDYVWMRIYNGGTSRRGWYCAELEIYEAV